MGQPTDFVRARRVHLALQILRTSLDALDNGLGAIKLASMWFAKATDTVLLEEAISSRPCVDTLRA